MESTSRVRFFVVVLPMEPVRATTWPFRHSRHARASFGNASKVEFTKRMAPPACSAAATASSLGWLMANAATAPASNAAGMNEWPSTFSPGSATYRPPGATSRESQVMLVATRSPSAAGTTTSASRTEASLLMENCITVIRTPSEVPRRPPRGRRSDASRCPRSGNPRGPCPQ